MTLTKEDETIKLLLRYGTALEAPTNAEINRLRSGISSTQERTAQYQFTSHRSTYRTRGVDELVSVALAVTDTPSSSGMGRAAPFLVPPFARLATCSRKHKAEKPSIKTLH
jgi:hypothetical protein